jgi:hypothetical protein
MATKRDQKTSVSKYKARLQKSKAIYKNTETNYKIAMFSLLKYFATTEQYKILENII